MVYFVDLSNLFSYLFRFWDNIWTHPKALSTNYITRNKSNVEYKTKRIYKYITETKEINKQHTEHLN